MHILHIKQNKKMKSIDKLFQDLESIGVTFKDKDGFVNFLFECSCRKVDDEKIERSSQTIRNMIKTRLVNMYDKFVALHEEHGYKYQIKFPTPHYSQINQIIKYENKHPGKDGLSDNIQIK